MKLTPQKKLNYKALKNKALDLFESKNYGEALPMFEQVAENNNNSDDWINVASTAILNKNIDKGNEALHKAIEIYHAQGTDNNLPVGQMRFYFMQALSDISKFDLAFEQLNIFKDILIDLKITDDHFLYIRGLPFLDNLLDKSVEIIKNQKIVNPVEWLNEFADGIDAEGKQKIGDFMKQF